MKGTPGVDASTLANDLSQQEMQGHAEKLSKAIEHLDSHTAARITTYTRLFSAEEYRRFWAMVEEYRTAGSSSMWEMLWQIDFERQPVPFTEWVEDPYYMGTLGKDLYPLWKKELSWVCDPASGVVEWYITGAIGLGKTFAALIAQLYKGPYYCSCLKDPQKYFGLASGTGMMFVLFNAQLANARAVNFDQISQFVNSSRYFRDHCPAVVQSTRIMWPSKQMLLRMGSSEIHALGQNLFGYMIDEVNFMETPIEKQEDEYQAYKIYHHASRRMQNRFERFGVNPGLACVVSSRLAHSSFLETLMEDNRDNPRCHVSDYAVWEAKGRHLYPPSEFKVAVGDAFHSSDVLTELDTSSGDPYTYTVKSEKPCPDGQKWMSIPANYYFEFLRDPDGSLRDIAGVPTFGASRLIYDVSSVHDCTKLSPGRVHPFLSETHELSMDDPSSNLLHCVKWHELTKLVKGFHVPLYFPYYPRFIHCDLGLTGDCSALAMGCVYDTFLVTDQDSLTGQISEAYKPKIWIDFMIRIKPVRGQQIDLAKIVYFILNMRHRGFFLQRVTFDGYASEMAIQAIIKSNQIQSKNRQKHVLDDKIDLQSSVLSVDKDDTPYRVLRDYLFQRGVNYYPYKPFTDEVLELEHDVKKRKVDHPAHGSKDVSDAVAGVVYSAATAKQYIPLTPTSDMLMAPGEPTIETETVKSTLSDYLESERIIDLSPPPAPEPRNTKLNSATRQAWLKQLQGYSGRKR